MPKMGKFIAAFVATINTSKTSPMSTYRIISSRDLKLLFILCFV